MAVNFILYNAGSEIRCFWNAYSYDGGTSPYLFGITVVNPPH